VTAAAPRGRGLLPFVTSDEFEERKSIGAGDTLLATFTRSAAPEALCVGGTAEVSVQGPGCKAKAQFQVVP